MIAVELGRCPFSIEWSGRVAGDNGRRGHIAGDNTRRRDHGIGVYRDAAEHQGTGPNPRPIADAYRTGDQIE